MKNKPLINIFGYKVLLKTKAVFDNDDPNNDDENESFYSALDEHSIIGEIKSYSLQHVYTICTSSGHNLAESDLEQIPIYFYGKIIERFETCKDDKTCEILAQQLSQKYSPVLLPDRDVLLQNLQKIVPSATLSELPMLTFVQTMCYCCT